MTLVDSSTGEIAHLTPEERGVLKAHEAVVEKGLATFVEVGQSLAAIRDGRLYRDEHRTFEDYCLNRWDITRSYAYRLMTAAEVVSPIGDTAPLPSNEAQARALAKVDPEDRADVMRAASEDGPATASKIEAAAAAKTSTPPASGGAADRSAPAADTGATASASGGDTAPAAVSLPAPPVAAEAPNREDGEPDHAGLGVEHPGAAGPSAAIREAIAGMDEAWDLLAYAIDGDLTDPDRDTVVSFAGSLRKWASHLENKRPVRSMPKTGKRR